MLFRLSILCLVLLTCGSLAASSSTAVAQESGAASEAASPPTIATIRVLIGARDKEPTTWKGRFEIHAGKVLRQRIWRRGPGDDITPEREFTLSTREVPTAGVRTALLENGWTLDLETTPDTAITVFVKDRERRFLVSELSFAEPQLFLRGDVRVDRVPRTALISGEPSEEDFPCWARHPVEGWSVVSLEHFHRGIARLDLLESMPEDFASFVPDGGGDRVTVKHFDGENWTTARAISEGGEDLTPPTAAYDGDGSLHVIWGRNENGNYDLVTRAFDSNNRTWGELTPIDPSPGADGQVVATTDANGDVWIAWQSWREGRFQIRAGRLADGEFHTVMPSEANQWSPSIAADSTGMVALAFDTHGDHSYDIWLARWSADGMGPILSPLANTLGFEARVALAYDSNDALWAAWEERGINWGGDDYGAVASGPGTGLYRDGSAIQTAVLQNSKRRSLPAPWGDNSPQSPVFLSHPQLAADDQGRVWLCARMQGKRRGRLGTSFETIATSWRGNGWSASLTVPSTDGNLDLEPSLAAVPGGLGMVSSSDGRLRYAAEVGAVNQNLYFSVLQADPSASAGEVSAAPASPSSHRPADDDSAIPLQELQETLTTERKSDGKAIQTLRDFRTWIGKKEYRILRGDFHRHTDLSVDGGEDGCLEDLWRYSLDVACLDWVVVTDHDSGSGREYPWWRTQKETDYYLGGEEFFPLFGYERTVGPPHGHRNVLFAQRGVRTLPRLLGTELGENVSRQDTAMLYRYLREHQGICATHTPATWRMGTEWLDHAADVEPVVEIYQGARHSYECAGAPRAIAEGIDLGGGFRPDAFVSDALKKGYRLGFFASSDHNSTHTSYAMVFSEERSRKGVLEGFRQRHCYGATDNILLLVTSGPHLMGDEFTSAEPPSFEVLATGTAEIRKIVVMKDMAVIHEVYPREVSAKFTWTDPAPQPGKTHVYYVRVEQDDGELAWSSPLWIRFAGK